MAMPPLAPVRNIPIGRTAWQAYRAEVRYFIPILKASVFPFGLLLGQIAMYGLAMILGSGIVAVIVLFASLAVLCISTTFLAVAVSRIVLLGPDTAAPVLVPKWRRRHWRFLGYILFFWVVFSSFGAMFVVIGTTQGEFQSTADPSDVIMYGLTSFAGIVAFFYSLLRCCFIFPAVAVDETYGLRDCWRLGRKQTLRIFIVLLIALLPVVIIHIMAAVGAGTILDSGKMISPPNSEWRSSQNVAVPSLIMLVMGTVTYLFVVAAITPISIAFRTCAGWSPDSAPGRIKGR